MIKGFYAAASAMIARLNQQKLLSHNIANLNTPGFKGALTHLQEYLNVEAHNQPSDSLDPDQVKLLGRLGLGVETLPETTNFSQGALRATGERLDLAIEGEGFFQLQTPGGERYTRDGRFTLDAESQVVTVDGYFLLDENGQKITLPEGSIRVDSTGEIMVDGASEAQINLAVFENPEEVLERDDNNTFIGSGAPDGEEPGSIQQGFLEMSNIDPAVVMTEMAKVARTYEAAQKMVQSQDQLLAKAINTLGRY